MSRPTLDSIAQQIQKRGLAVPAIFFLELHKPLTGIASSMVTAANPLLRLLFQKENIESVQEILESSERIEDLIITIERHDAERRNKVTSCRG